eukprot:360575-Prymnesium_polylepis.1
MAAARDMVPHAVPPHTAAPWAAGAPSTADDDELSVRAPNCAVGSPPHPSRPRAAARALRPLGSGSARLPKAPRARPLLARASTGGRLGRLRQHRAVRAARRHARRRD